MIFVVQMGIQELREVNVPSSHSKYREEAKFKPELA